MDIKLFLLFALLCLFVAADPIKKSSSDESSSSESSGDFLSSSSEVKVPKKPFQKFMSSGKLLMRAVPVAVRLHPVAAKP